MYNENTALLKKIYRSSKTAIDALEAAFQKSNSFDFEQFLERQQYKYFDIAEDANMQLKTHNLLPDDMDLLSRIEFLTNVKFRIGRSDSQNHIAEFLIEGCMGGVMEMIHEIRTSPTATPECIDLAHMLIETEQETIASLERFL